MFQQVVCTLQGGSISKCATAATAASRNLGTASSWSWHAGLGSLQSTHSLGQEQAYVLQLLPHLTEGSKATTNKVPDMQLMQVLRPDHI